MTDAATMHHSAVEPAETPVTPESWGKLGMWIFLAGDAVGFGVLLASYGVMRATSVDWPNPFNVLGINLTAFMTFLLICSSVTMVKALEKIGLGERRAVAPPERPRRRLHRGARREETERVQSGDQQRQPRLERRRPDDRGHPHD